MLDLKRREFIALVGGGGLLLAAKVKRAWGQHPARVPRIGIIDDAPMWHSFRQALHEFGYVEGKSTNCEYRYSEGVPDRLTAVVGELIRRPVDLIAGYGTPPAEAAKAATTTIPIVMIGVGDPVRVGLVASLARPGGNITGNTVLSPDLGAKRLQLLREAIPSVARVAYLTPLIPIAAIPPPAARRLGFLRNFAVSSASTACRLVGSLVGTAGELADCPAISMEDGGDRIRYMAIFVAAIGFWAKHTRHIFPAFLAGAGLLALFR